MKEINTKGMIVMIAGIIAITLITLTGTCAIYLSSTEEETSTATPTSTQKIERCYEHQPHKREINGYITLRCSFE